MKQLSRIQNQTLNIQHLTSNIFLLVAFTLIVCFSTESGAASGGQTLANNFIIDSLLNELQTATSKQKPAILNELSKEYKYTSPEKSREFATQALKLAKKLILLNKKSEKNLLKEYVAEALYNIGVAFYYQIH